MPDISARHIGTTALRILGVAAAEMPLSADMAQSALEALNALLDSWATERLLVFTRPKIALPLVPGKAHYTWGLSTPPADIPREPPVRLELALLTVQETPPGLEWEVQVLDQTAYETQIWLKTLQSTYVEYVYLEDTLPVHILHCWPVPHAPGTTLQLVPWTAHAPYAHWDDVLPWPNGYQRAMTWGLACELALQYGIEPSPTLLRTAEEAKRAIFPINTEVGRLSLTPGRPRGGTPYDYPRGFREGWK